jgi:hypothetical protein
VAIRRVFPSGEDKDGGARGEGGGGVDTDDGVFHVAAHALVVVFRVCDVSAGTCVWGVATAR